ncbi:MAG: DUF2892 domain-containing protein [Candidatus Muiribacterium halophilum]|uniref:DUF2892 domain-containing protein n=1 Tax=Muiribacterium halophilum TaxID=2053465 RepID=A0A2N5ZKE1_MUIH1|nr:MAG: DUF2892 domain-containing protein [Candidatus Muirbacterium halophilum]
MTIERMLRLIAGLFIMLSVAGYLYLSHYFIYFIAFIGLNLFQSGITNWCPMVWILKKVGFKS